MYASLPTTPLGNMWDRSGSMRSTSCGTVKIFNGKARPKMSPADTVLGCRMEQRRLDFMKPEVNRLEIEESEKSASA